MMKQIISTLILIITGISLYAQVDFQIGHNEKVIGKNLKTNTDIRAEEYVFPERIEHSYIDTASRSLTVHLRGLSNNQKYLNNNGNFILYDLSREKVKWSHKFNYLQDNIVQQDDVFVITSLNKSYCVSMENNETKWEVKNRMYFVDSKHKVGIGFRSNLFSNGNALEGIDLNTGKVLWTKILDAQFEWKGVFHLNDSVVIIVARGLHAINLKTGKGWDYDAVTSLNNFSGSFRELESNIVADSAGIYFASQTQMVRLDNNGNIIWTQSLPKETSISSIYFNGSLLCLVNKGYGLGGYNQLLPCGKPYIARFDIKTGQQLFLTIMEGKKQMITGVSMSRDDALLVTKNKVTKYSLKDGSFLFDKTIEQDSIGGLKFFIGNLVYFKVDSIYKRLESIDSTKHYLWTEGGKVLALDEKLEISGQYESKQLFLEYLNKKDHRFISNDKETFVLDKADKIVAELKITTNAICIGSKLYDVNKQNFIEMDIADLIK